MSAGSELSPGVVSQLLVTVAVFEIVPLVAVTFTGTVISGKFVFAAIAAETVHVMV
jgi:hypothetical protein